MINLNWLVKFGAGYGTLPCKDGVSLPDFSLPD